MITVIPRKIMATSVNGVQVADDGSITLPVDNAPTTNSTNLVTSGGVKTELDALSARIGNAENPAQVWTDVTFSIPTSSWSLSNSKYTATVQSSSILSTSGVFVNYDSLDNAVTPITAEESTGQVTFTTDKAPTGTITGTFRIVDSVNGIVPVERGGTGTNSLSGALTALGAVAKTGDTMTGRLIVKMDNAAVWLKKEGSTDEFTAAFRQQYIGSANHTVIQQRTDGSAATESYYFPIPDPTPSYISYDILTSKKPVTIAQGGTGATTAADARANLGAVAKAGDTMTGDLILKKSNNYPGLFFNRYTNPDANPQQMIQPNGTGSHSFIGFYQRINGDSAWEAFRLPSTIDSLSSNVVYAILTSKSPVTIAQGGTGCTDLGSITTVTGAATNVANDTVTNLGSITLEAGIYIVQVGAHFDSNATGYRQIGLSTNATTQNMDRYTIVRIQAAPTVATETSFSYCMKVSSKTTYYVNGRQTSGGTLSCNCGIRAMKIAAV